MSGEAVRYAVLGLGRSGVGIHLAQLRARPDAKVVAVCDPLPGRAEKVAAELGCQAYAKPAKMLKQADIEVVVVATPSLTHARDAKQALKAGKHVVLEKPMATSLAEAEGIIRVANQTGRKLFVHHNYRFHKDFLHLQEVLRSGVLGRVYHIRRYLCGFMRRNDWQAFVKNGGGLLNNHGTHAIDQILHLVGAPIVQVMGDMQHLASGGDAEDHFKAFMRADNGVTVDLEMSTAQNVALAMPKWIICGSQGTLTNETLTRGTEKTEKFTVRWFDPAQLPALQVVDGPAVSDFQNPEVLPWQERVVELPFGATNVPEFYDNVRDVLRSGAIQVVTPESVREVMRVIGMIRKAAATKKVVHAAVAPLPA